jgi:hypothetical protein
MSKLILYLWLSGQMTNEKYQALKNYQRVFKRQSWCERHLIADTFHLSLSNLIAN